MEHAEYLPRDASHESIVLPLLSLTERRATHGRGCISAAHSISLHYASLPFQAQGTVRSLRSTPWVCDPPARVLFHDPRRLTACFCSVCVIRTFSTAPQRRKFLPAPEQLRGHRTRLGTCRGQDGNRMGMQKRSAEKRRVEDRTRVMNQPVERVRVPSPKNTPYS